MVNLASSPVTKSQTDSCQLCDSCDFYKSNASNGDAVIKNFVKLYCVGSKNEYCIRMKFEKEKGIRPPKNMLPTGQIIRYI